MKIRNSHLAVLSVALALCAVSPGCKKKPVTDGSQSQTGTGSGSGSETGVEGTQDHSGSVQPDGAAAHGGSAQVSAEAQEGSSDKALLVQKNCVTMTYHHKELKSHASGEACTEHRNLIKFSHAGINPGSVCVRVNGTPVAFKPIMKKGEPLVIGAILGPIAGPKSKITARYCMGAETCPEECKVPRDEFLDAIGGADLADKGKIAQWDAGDKVDKDVTQEVEAELKKELADGSDLIVFDDWIGDKESPACGTRTAQR